MTSLQKSAEQRGHRARLVRLAVSPYLWMGATLATLVAFLLVTFTGTFAQDEITKGVYPEVAGVATLYFLAIFAIPWAVRRPVITTRAWVPWGAAAITLVAMLGAIALWWLNRWGMGYQWIQTLKVVSGPYGWGDLKLYFDWLVCSQQGIDPITSAAGSCVAEPMNYGPGFLWWTPLAFLRPAMDVIGIGMAVMSALALAWLARYSAPWGAITLLVTAVSSAWITLIERGNFDVLILWIAIGLVIATRRFRGVRPWIVGAVLILILGTWKYYPFAMVVSLIPVVRLRRGWLVLTGFMAVALAYFAMYWDAAIGDMGTHAGLGGGLGRTTLAAFIAGEATPSGDFRSGDAGVFVLVALAAVWGASVAGKLGEARVRKLETRAMLAASGSVAILGSVLLAGSGFIYKSALLFLAVPLLAALAQSGKGVLWRPGLAMLGLVAVAALVEWNPLASSAALLMAASFSFGLSVVVLLRGLSHSKSSTQEGSVRPFDTSTANS